MKKIISVILCIFIAISLVACANKSGSDATTPNTNESTDSTKPNETEPAIEYPPLNENLDVGDSVLDGKIALNGVLYQMPIAVSELMENGWSFKDETVLKDKTLSNGFVFSNGDMYFVGSVVNVSGSDAGLESGHVVRIIVGHTLINRFNIEKFIPVPIQASNKIRFGSSPDEVRAMADDLTTDIEFDWDKENTMLNLECKIKKQGGTLSGQELKMTYLNVSEPYGMEIYYLPDGFLK